MLTSLEQKRLVQREPDPNDGRAWLVRLTAKGRRTFKTVRRQTEAFRARLTSNLAAHQRESLLQMLGDVVAAMDNNVTQDVE
jgi:DNA-binding MarR family transcriptional regulator